LCELIYKRLNLAKALLIDNFVPLAEANGNDAKKLIAVPIYGTAGVRII